MAFVPAPWTQTSDEEVDYDSLSVSELKARIKRGGKSFADCYEVSALRQRAKDVDAAKKRKNKSASNASTAAVTEQSEGVRERRPPATARVASDVEADLLKKAAALATESTQVISGRDASVILGEAADLRKQIEETSLTKEGKKKMLESLEEVDKGLALENAIEKHCVRVVQLAMLAMAVVPMLVTFLENIAEYAVRPEMEVEPTDLAGKVALITGGCGAVGLNLATMLADSGASVLIACHGATLSDVVDVESHLSNLGLLRESSWDGDISAKPGKRKMKAGVEVWPLQLESFQFVRDFASRVAKRVGSIDIFVHAAATKLGCNKTVDGHELVTQVNYLSPFLLTHLLRPSLQAGSRVLHVTCDAALQQPDWLPWPLRRIEVDLLPRIDLDGLSKREVLGSCSSLVEYANSKLAIVLHSHELNRRLASDVENGGVSHVVNPGAMDTAFGRSDSVPARSSSRSSFMGYFPPVWIAQKIYSFTLGKGISALGNFMLRPVEVGAKALFHVATSAALSKEESGGGLFSDKAGPFINCGRPSEDCGRIQPIAQPFAALDEELASELWDRTETAIGQRMLRPI
eukprot:TRINITY_DN23207_c0_g3_i4.p1 TRINITY_DN23207_c0_g3~~TRINITY_DN23207_c0_g3_i4.p1  ORF type:complete len:577 (-),score=83.04 TRINITY_DN23207_c0_g3_i4:92-1822(-)